MARYNPPQHPDDSHKREEQAHRTTTVVQQIGAQLRELHGQFVSLVGEIKSNNKETETKTEERSEKHLASIKRSTNATWVFSGISLAIACVTLWMLSNQLDIMRADQRAWMGVVSVQLNPLKVGENIIATAYVKNFGKTPSLGTTIRVRISEPFPPEQRKEAIEKEIATFDESRVASRSVVFPNQITRSIRDSLTATMAQKGIDDFYTEKMQLLVVVRIRYEDQFRVLHHTQYCGVYNPKNNGFDTAEECNEAD